MKTLIGIFDDHEAAVTAVSTLKASGYPIETLTIVGRSGSEEVDKEARLMEKNPLQMAELAGTTTVGVALGVLTGVGLFAIPGLGFLYGAGALVGAIAGLDFGIIGGGIASVLATLGVKDEYAEKYKTALTEGKYLLVAQGDQDVVQKAHEVLNASATHEGVLMQ